MVPDFASSRLYCRNSTSKSGLSGPVSSVLYSKFAGKSGRRWPGFGRRSWSRQKVWGLVGDVQVAVDGSLQFGSALMHAAAQLLFGEQTEPALHQQPRGASEVHGSGAAWQTSSGSVLGVVVRDQVDVEVGGHLGLDGIRNLRNSTARCLVATTNHLAGPGVRISGHYLSQAGSNSPLRFATVRPVNRRRGTLDASGEPRRRTSRSPGPSGPCRQGGVRHGRQDPQPASDVERQDGL